MNLFHVVGDPEHFDGFFIYAADLEAAVIRSVDLVTKSLPVTSIKQVHQVEDGDEFERELHSL